MANEHNLKPFSKGQSGNPKGRPKGALSAKTIIRKWLESETQSKNPLTKEEETMPVMEAMTIAMIGQALKGDVRAYNALLDRMEGKPRQHVEMSGEDGGPIPVAHSTDDNIDYSKLTDDVLLAITRARKKPNNEQEATDTTPKNGGKSKSAANTKKRS